MPDTASSFLTGWAGFYTAIATAASALTGLMFVVITLVTGGRSGSSHEGIATFSTPTVLHFTAALLVSAILLAPWHSPKDAAVVVAIVGLYGVVHTFRALLLSRRLRGYEPDLEDLIFYSVLPLVAHAAILGGALATFGYPEKALFALASGVLLLIFIGIRNSWDVVTFIALDIARSNVEPKPGDADGDGRGEKPNA